MRRRDFVKLIASAGAVLPMAAHAQESGRLWRIGSLSPGPTARQSESLTAFLKQLNELGYIEGKNMRFDRRAADGVFERLPALAADLVGANVDIILAESSFAVAAAGKATRTIPIVMTGVGNPVGSGFVKSITAPGGNITGLTNISIEVSSKYLEYLRAVVPRLTRVGVMIDPEHPNHPAVLKQIQIAAQGSNVSLSAIELRSAGGTEAALDQIKREQVGALIVPPDPTFPIVYQQIIAFTLANRLPSIFGQREGVVAGGLMSYAPNPIEMYKRAAALVDKILKGARPGDIPVEFPTRFSFILNLKTSKALGLDLPAGLLNAADEVIE